MNSLAYIPASDGAANASLMTVTNVRSGGATTIQVNTVANAPTKFYASYGTPHTFTDPVTGETITVISEATAVDFAGHIDGSNVEIDQIAPGYTDNGNEVGDIIVIRPVTEWANNIFNTLSVAHNDDGTLKADSVTTAAIADGAVTADKIGVLPAFSAVLPSSQSIPSATLTLMNATVEEYDLTNNYDTATKAFTAPIDGIYSFSVVATGASGTAAWAAYLYVNANNVARSPYASAQSIAGASVTSSVKLNAGDVVTAQIYCASASALTSNSGFTYFCGSFESRV